VAGDVEVAGGVRAATEPLPVADPPGVRSARAVGREDASADRIAGVVGAGVAVRAGEGRMEAALRRVAGIRSAGVTVVAESGGVSAAARGIAEVVRARIAVVTLCRRVGMGAAEEGIAVVVGTDIAVIAPLGVDREDAGIAWCGEVGVAGIVGTEVLVVADERRPRRASRVAVAVLEAVALVPVVALGAEQKRAGIRVATGMRSGYIADGIPR